MKAANTNVYIFSVAKVLKDSLIRGFYLWPRISPHPGD